MTRVLSVSSAGGSLELGAQSGVRAGLKVRGMGMPGVSLQWFEGAGDGRSFRGGRTLSRVLDMPVKITGANRQEVLQRYSQFARIFVLDNAPVTLEVELDGEGWRAEVVRTGGGDYTMGDDTDGSTWLKTVLTIESGDPFWTRVNSEARVITPGGLGIPLLGPGQSLAQLRMSNTEGSGAVQFTNSGDVEAWPTWRVLPPFQAFEFERDGLTLEWSQAAVKTTGYIDVDSMAGTITDEAGVNRYDGLAAAPKFFSIPPGTSSASVILTAATGDTRVNVAWHPRKVVLF
ncbi:minor tail protein [Microbacterium phage DelaGarza]|nr:minor tail protein [Microbacterium phage DelaGarza]